MTNPIAFLILCFISWDNLSQEPTTENLIDWDMLTVVRTCTVNKKYCDDKLSIDNALRAKIQVCGQKARNLTIDKAELQKSNGPDQLCHHPLK